jgi:hypothetical protein
MTKMVSLHNTRPPAKHCRLEVLSVTCVSILFLSPEPRTLPHSIRRLWADAIDRPWCAIDFTQLRLHAVPTFHISKQMLHLKISANACRSNRVEVIGRRYEYSRDMVAHSRFQRRSHPYSQVDFLFRYNSLSVPPCLDRTRKLIQVSFRRREHVHCATRKL